MEKNITSNASHTTNATLQVRKAAMEKSFIPQVLVVVFLYVNCIMIFTFFKKEVFRSDTRYILFAQMLFLDSALMVLTDVVVIEPVFTYAVPCFLCLIFSMIMIWLAYGTPLTLGAMCLERYVAICKPLRHAEISSPKTRLLGLFLIGGFSLIPALAELLPFVSNPLPSFCTVTAMKQYTWQNNTRAVLSQLYFVVLSSIITFTYIKIMAAAKAASSERKKSSNGLKTVMLHGFQLFLCSIQLWCPFVEAAIMPIDYNLFLNVRFYNFIAFVIAPRCLSPLIYGLRDEKFYVIFKYYVFWGMNKRISPVFPTD